MPFISKKYFSASSPSVFRPHIIGIQSDKLRIYLLRLYFSSQYLHL